MVAVFTDTWEHSQQGSWERSQLARSEHYTIYNAATCSSLFVFNLYTKINSGSCQFKQNIIQIIHLRLLLDFCLGRLVCPVLRQVL